MRYNLTGIKDGKPVGTLTLFAASATKEQIEADAPLMMKDAGCDCDSVTVAPITPVLVCPTCKSDRWAEIHPKASDPTGFTLYCRRCEEGCVSPILL